MSTSAQTIVDTIDAAILAMMSNGAAQTLSISGKSVTYSDLNSLQAARKYYAGLAASTSNKFPFKMMQAKPEGVN